MKYALLLVFVVTLSGCSDLFSPDSFLAPTPISAKLNGDQLGNDFPPDSKQGWKDGCESGYAVYGTDVYKSFYGFKRDTTKIGNYEYETEWYNGYNYCRQEINTLYNQGAFN